MLSIPVWQHDAEMLHEAVPIDSSIFCFRAISEPIHEESAVHAASGVPHIRIQLRGYWLSFVFCNPMKQHLCRRPT